MPHTAGTSPEVAGALSSIRGRSIKSVPAHEVSTNHSCFCPSRSAIWLLNMHPLRTPATSGGSRTSTAGLETQHCSYINQTECTFTSNSAYHQPRSPPHPPSKATSSSENDHVISEWSLWKTSGLQLYSSRGSVFLVICRMFLSQSPLSSPAAFTFTTEPLGFRIVWSIMSVSTTPCSSWRDSSASHSSKASSRSTDSSSSSSWGSLESLPIATCICKFFQACLGEIPLRFMTKHLRKFEKERGRSNLWKGWKLLGLRI